VATTTSTTDSTATSSATSTAITSDAKSEIDKYGVDLYTLTQGMITLEKSINTKKFEITYTRTGDSVVRKAVSIDTSGGKTTLTNTIDLNFKSNLPALIKQMEDEIAANCKVTVTTECTQSKKALVYLKASCVSLQSNEATADCVMAAAMSSL